MGCRVEGVVWLGWVGVQGRVIGIGMVSVGVEGWVVGWGQWDD